MYTNPKTEDEMREIRRVKMNEQTWYMEADVCKRVGISNCTVAMRSISPGYPLRLRCAGDTMWMWKTL